MGTNGIILAGGKSSRLAPDKASEIIGDKSLLHRVISDISSLTDRVIVVIAPEASWRQFYGYPGVIFVPDIYPGNGPLGGIHSGLMASDTHYNLVVACDMPFLNIGLLRYLRQVADGFDLVIPRWGQMVEPLHAVYARTCLAPIEDMIRRNDLRIVHLFDQIKVRYVEAVEIERFDPEHTSFFNVNTKADLEQARKLARKAA